jgi:hypothetical protein
MNYKDEILAIMDKLPHRLQVRFAYLCCMDVRSLIKDDKPIRALKLVELWLKDESKVSKKELLDVSSAAFNPHTVGNSADIISESSAAQACYAAADVARAGDYVTYARDFAAYTSYAAARAVCPDDYVLKIKDYYELAKTMTRDLTMLEKLVFNLEEI